MFDYPVEANDPSVELAAWRAETCQDEPDDMPDFDPDVERHLLELGEDQDLSGW